MFSHPNIIKLFEYIKTDKVHYLVLEYVSGGELYSLLEKKGKLPECEARKYFYQVLKAIDYLHSQRISHRDIKPENILLDEHKNIKLADFGLSNLMRDGEFLSTACGSANYAAPEVITGSKYCGTEVDVWSLGILLYALLTGTLPFDDISMPALISNIKSAKFIIPHYITPNASDLLKKLIIVNQSHRLTIPQIFKHAWISEAFPIHIRNKQKPYIIDENIFRDVLKYPKFADLKNYDDLRRNILARNNFDIFTVTYEMMLYAKMNETCWEKDEMKTLFTISDVGDKRKDYRPNDWKYGFILDESPDEIMMNLLLMLKEMNGKWVFMGPYNIKAILKGANKKFHVKTVIRLYSVRFIKEDNVYFLDFKLEKGNFLRFLDVCYKIYIEFHPNT
ncbi:hypothetical protein SteCoe_19338 [Stentor coeruleus]|uniref:Protein kinase domain-containing protein n=1 Tax=Stentor coeruleus TaxID=5963 RepID=A0A1R2BUE9_9CILI|nr:hypothetical protein SteCoe_19338 [Stentor coeruleus]